MQAKVQILQISTVKELQNKDNSVTTDTERDTQSIGLKKKKKIKNELVVPEALLGFLKHILNLCFLQLLSVNEDFKVATDAISFGISNYP